MLWWCETKKNHFDISCILPKAQQQLDEPANIAISSQIPLTHQVNTYVLVVGMCGQAFYMEIIYVLSNNWNKIHANYRSICFVENQESMPACTIYIYIYILTILEGKISSYSRLNLLFNLYEFPQLKQECPHL